jgi:hypothetical protein
MNILQIDISNKSINDFFKNKDIKLIFLSQNINGTKNHIMRKLKYIIDLKYGNYNFYNIDPENNLLILFKNNINNNNLNNLKLLNDVINYYNNIKKILKKDNLNNVNINLLYSYVIEFYTSIFIINNLESNFKINHKKLKKKLENIKLLLYIKYILKKKNIDYDYYKIKKIYKNEQNLFINKDIKKIFNKNIKKINKTYIFKKELNLGFYSTNCFCINNYVNNIKDEKYKNYLLQKLYSYEKKYMSI